MFEPEAFRQFESVKMWMAELASLRKSTKYVYGQHLRYFCDWIEKTPDELLQTREADLKKEKPTEQRRMERQVKKYLASLTEQEKSRGFKKQAYAAVRSFFARQYVPLQFFRSDAPRGPPPTPRVARKDEIRKMLTYADERARALILTLCQSGLRISDAVNLKYGDIREDFEANRTPCLMQVVTQKTNTPTVTFLGQDAIDALHVYFNLRKRGTVRYYGPKARKGIPAETITDESPLFRTRESSHVKRVSVKQATEIIRMVSVKAGVGFISAHAFRRWFQTTLEQAHIPPNWVLRMMGHSLPGVEGSYSRPEIEQMRDAYKNAELYLSLVGLPEATLQTVQRLQNQIKELQEKNVELKQRVNGYSTQTQEIASLVGIVEKLGREVEELKRKVKAP
jgi:integrase